MFKKILTSCLIFALSANICFAEVLGTKTNNGWDLKLGEGTYLYKNTYLSADKGVGQQTEYYSEYTPNDKIKPIVITGDALYGKRTSTEVIDYMKSNGYIPMVGINASFFSFQTGVPMGHVITNGEVTSKDSRTLMGVGFKQDGSAFISNLTIKTTLSFGETVIDIPNINKYCSKEGQAIILYTPDYGTSTLAQSKTVNVVLGEINGNIGIGKALTAIAEEVIVSDAPVAIPEGKYLLNINADGGSTIPEILQSIEPGTEVTIETGAAEQIWYEAYNGLASEGKRLLENGEVCSGFEAGATPRTAVGIKADGTVIFYVLDGRQSDYSYGARQETLAKRMAELGCVDALNLDGGGSTTISGIYPGCETSTVINSPSEGTQRKVTNFIFLHNTAEKTGDIGAYYLYPFSGHYLSGSSFAVDVRAVDTNSHPAEPGEYTLMGNEYSNIDGNTVTVHGTGTAEVTVSDGNVSDTYKYFTYETPNAIYVYNRDNNMRLNSIPVKPGDTIRLDIKAYYDKIQLSSVNSLFTYTIDSDIGYVTENGELVISEYCTGGGDLKIKAGYYEITIPVIVNGVDEVFSDINNHWAKKTILYMNKTGVINGYSENGKNYFKPEGEITRTEFTVMAVRYLGMDTDNYEKTDLSVFADRDEIPEWALPYVRAALAEGVMTGKENNGGLYFSPDSKITREEVMTVIARFADTEAVASELDFDDAEEISAWARDSVAALVSMGIVSGYDNNTIKPKSRVTRAEAVTMLYNSQDM